MRPCAGCSKQATSSCHVPSIPSAVPIQSTRSKKAIEDWRSHLKPDEVFYYADEFNISWQPTLKAMWSRLGQQGMIPSYTRQLPRRPKKRYGLGAVNYHTGETVVLARRLKCRREVADLLEALLRKHAHERIYAAQDNVSTHFDAKIEAVVRAAAGGLCCTFRPIARGLTR